MPNRCTKLERLNWKLMHFGLAPAKTLTEARRVWRNLQYDNQPSVSVKRILAGPLPSPPNDSMKGVSDGE